jgi:cytochrome c oxidase subunit 4
MSTDAHANHAHEGHAGHDHDHDGHDDDDGAVHVHIASTPFYIGIFLALIFLTFMTVKVSYYDFGSANIIIAMLIATMKATLVAAFFMHLRHDKLFNTLAFLGSFLFLAIFILLTYDDLGKRGEVDPAYGGTVNVETGAPAPGGEPATTATQDDVEEEAPKAAPGSSAGGGEKPGPGKKE